MFGLLQLAARWTLASRGLFAETPWQEADLWVQGIRGKPSYQARAVQSSYSLRAIESLVSLVQAPEMHQHWPWNPCSSPQKKTDSFAGLPARSGCYDARAADLFACGVWG